MKCPSCNLFASLEMGEVEVDSLEVEHTAPGKDETTHVYTVTGNVRIVRTSACCGDEMKEANFDLEVTVEVEADELPKGADPTECEAESTNEGTIEEGGGRYAKSFYGAEVEGTVSIMGADEHMVEIGTWTYSDKVAASSMDELV